MSQRYIHKHVPVHVHIHINISTYTYTYTYVHLHIHIKIVPYTFVRRGVPVREDTYAEPSACEVG